MSDPWSVFWLHQQRGGKPKLSLKIHEEVHPSLVESAKQLEMMVIIFFQFLKEYISCLNITNGIRIQYYNVLVNF